jgi:DNA-binding transcriptional LysR family regulator
MDWDKLRIFHAVADAGSLTHAGDTLHLSQSAVSRQIRALEESLNTTLFHRHARGLILTEQGELLFDATRRWPSGSTAAEARIRDSEEEVFGELRVTTTIGFGTLWLAPRLPKLFEPTPICKIDLMLEERVLDLPMREADVAIRMKEPSQADLIRRKLMGVYMCFTPRPPIYLGIGVLPDYLAEDFPNWSGYAPMSPRTRCRSTSPIPRNCANPSGSRRSAISSPKRSSPIAGAPATAPTPPRPSHDAPP